MALDTLRIGILGAARIAPAALIHPARRTGLAEVTAIAARDGNRAAAFASRHDIAHAYSSYAELVESPEVDAVYIGLPNALHFAWCLRALAAGKHVLCEKPLTSNALEAEVLARVSAPNSPVLMEAMHSLHHPLMKRAVEVVRSDELGSIERIEAVFRTPMLRRTDIRFDYALGGGALMDLGCYTVSMVRALCGGEPTVTFARATLLDDRVDRRMQALLSLPGDGTAAIDVEMKSLRTPRIEVVCGGSRGTLRLLNPLLPGLWNRFEVRTGSTARREVIERVSSYDCQLRAFVDAIRGGARPLTSAAFALDTMRVIDAIYAAAGLPHR